MRAQFGQEVLLLRVGKDSFFSHEMDSPIPPNERANFKGLNYFLLDETYRVSTKLGRFDSPKRIVIGTSTGNATNILEVWGLHFRGLRDNVSN